MFTKKKITVAYTVEKCNKCGLEKKREYKAGDFLFTELSKCNSCSGVTFIEKIFGETIEK